jgi:heterogeneous nuclear ribonucleoprotein F/H
MQAMAKNGEFIGERYVKLLLVPRQEMEEQVRMGTIAIPGGAARARAGLLKRRGMRLPLHSNMPGMPGTVDMLLNVMPNGAAMLSPHPYSQPHATFSSPVPVR